MWGRWWVLNSTKGIYNSLSVLIRIVAGKCGHLNKYVEIVYLGREMMHWIVLTLIPVPV